MAEVVFSGFGGQGVLTSGLAMSYVAMKHDYQVLWSPAYGASMRGGKAYSLVKFDKEEIDGPVMSDLDILVCMNAASLDFVENLKEDGLLIINSDIVPDDVEVETNATVVRIAINSMADEIKAPKSANLISVGYIANYMGLEKQTTVDAVCGYFEKKGNGRFNVANTAAILAGYDYQKEE